MNALDGTCAIWWLAALVFLPGVASAWFARLSEGSRHQTSSQWVFFTSLAAVGATTIACLFLARPCWCLPAFTLSTMILTVMCDFSRYQQAAPQCDPWMCSRL